jgi:hypothetical protein
MGVSREDVFERMLELRGLLISRARNETVDPNAYMRLRKELMPILPVRAKLPDFVRTSFTLSDFWAFIQPKFDSYAARQAFLNEQFEPVLSELDPAKQAPADKAVSDTLERVDWEHVQEAWTKALNRRDNDPDGAVTSARSLVESVCKHVLDEGNEPYDQSEKLPKLYSQAAKLLKLSPEQHTEQKLKQILQGCTSVVHGLAAVRNDMSDSHGKPKYGYKAEPRHAEFAVNVAGALASFLVRTWEARNEEAKAAPASFKNR